MEIGESLLARRAEMVRKLVVLHERAVDDRHAEINVEQDRHRLELANDDVAQDANERENSLGVRRSSRELASQSLPFLEQILQYALEHHSRDANGMEHDENCHAGSAEPLVDRHLLTCGDCERYSLRVTIDEVHIAR